MPTLRIAHLREQGQNMVIVPLDSSFGQKTSSEQATLIAAIQRASTSAGLAGTVVPVWETAGRMHFIAPRPWHPYFQRLSMPAIAQNLNKTLSW